MTKITDLLNKIKEELAPGLPFMDNREKGSLITNTELTINNLGFLHGDDGEYSVITLKEDDKLFYFGGQVVTEKMKRINTLLSDVQLKEVLEDGIPVKFKKIKSEKGRDYIDLEIL